MKLLYMYNTLLCIVNNFIKIVLSKSTDPDQSTLKIVTRSEPTLFDVSFGILNKIYVLRNWGFHHNTVGKIVFIFCNVHVEKIHSLKDSWTRMSGKVTIILQQKIRRFPYNYGNLRNFCWRMSFNVTLPSTRFYWVYALNNKFWPFKVFSA